MECLGGMNRKQTGSEHYPVALFYRYLPNKALRLLLDTVILVIPVLWMMAWVYLGELRITRDSSLRVISSNSSAEKHLLAHGYRMDPLGISITTYSKTSYRWAR